MAYRKNILTVTYHYDDDTGIYDIGEIDCGLGDDLTKYVQSYGLENLLYYLKVVLPKRIEDFIEYDKKGNPSLYK